MCIMQQAIASYTNAEVPLAYTFLAVGVNRPLLTVNEQRMFTFLQYEYQGLFFLVSCTLWYIMEP